MAKARLAERDQRRIDRLVGAALRPQRHPARRRDEQEAGVLVAGVIERIEAAGDERVVDGADREQPRRRTGRRQASAASIRNRLFSAMPSSMCWPLFVASPFLRRGNLRRGEYVGHFVAAEQAALVHPGAEIGRDGDVGRGGDDPVGERRRRPSTDRAGSGRTRPGSIAPRRRARRSPAPRPCQSIAASSRGRSGCARPAASTPGRALPPSPRAAPTPRLRAIPIVSRSAAIWPGSSGRHDCPCGRRRAGRSP